LQQKDMVKLNSVFEAIYDKKVLEITFELGEGKKIETWHF